MGISQLVDTLVDDIKPAISQLDDVLRLAEQARVLSQVSQIEAVKAGEYGRGISQAADEVGELSKTAFEFGRVVSMVIKSSNDCLNETQYVASLLENYRNSSVSLPDLHARLSEVSEKAEATQRLLNRNMEILPVSFLGRDNELTAAMDTVQMEYLIRQVMRNARDKLNAVKTFLKSVKVFCERFSSWDQISDDDINAFHHEIKLQLKTIA